MKRFLLLLLVTLFVVALAETAMADGPHSTINVSVHAIDAIWVTDGAEIELNTVDVNGMIIGTDDQTARLRYTHNSPGTKILSAEVLPAGLPPAEHLNLTVQVAGGVINPVTLVNHGDAQGAIDIWTNISRGRIQNAVITYGASDTGETAIGDYLFTVTFTSRDT